MTTSLEVAKYLKLTKSEIKTFVDLTNTLAENYKTKLPEVMKYVDIFAELSEKLEVLSDKYNTMAYAIYIFKSSEENDLKEIYDSTIAIRKSLDQFSALLFGDLKNAFSKANQIKLKSIEQSSAAAIEYKEMIKRMDEEDHGRLETYHDLDKNFSFFTKQSKELREQRKKQTDIRTQIGSLHSDFIKIQGSTMNKVKWLGKDPESFDDDWKIIKNVTASYESDLITMKDNIIAMGKELVSPYDKGLSTCYSINELRDRAWNVIKPDFNSGFAPGNDSASRKGMC